MQQQQPYYPPPAPGIGYLNIILIGIVLLMVSGILLSLIYVLDDGQDVVAMLGVIVNEVGLGLMGIGLVMGALKDETLHHHTRVAMLISMGIIFAYIHLKLLYISGYI